MRKTNDNITSASTSTVRQVRPNQLHPPTQLGTVQKDLLSGKTHEGGTWSYCQLT